MVVPVTDETGAIRPDRIRIMWGRMENFKCVDYFQVEYFQRLAPQSTVQMTPRINRHRRSMEIEVLPCTDYFFKVIASEDWKGMREDFKMFSEVVAYSVDYTPRFVRSPVVVERPRTQQELTREELRAQRRREMQRKRQMYGHMMVADEEEGNGEIGEVDVQEEEEDILVKVTWRLSDIDYPHCLDRFVLEYFDTLYNETGLSRTIARPFTRGAFDVEVASTEVPCEMDYVFWLHAVGLNGHSTRATWTPPSCVVTTPPPTTTVTISPEGTEPEETTTDVSVVLDELRAENEQLQAKLGGLKQEYEKIGLQVFYAFKESFFQNLEDFLARRKSEQEGGFFPGGGTAPAAPGGTIANETEASFF